MAKRIWSRNCEIAEQSLINLQKLAKVFSYDSYDQPWESHFVFRFFASKFKVCIYKPWIGTYDWNKAWTFPDDDSRDCHRGRRIQASIGLFAAGSFWKKRFARSYLIFNPLPFRRGGVGKANTNTSTALPTVRLDKWKCQRRSHCVPGQFVFIWFAVPLFSSFPFSCGVDRKRMDNHGQGQEYAGPRQHNNEDSRNGDEGKAQWFSFISSVVETRARNSVSGQLPSAPNKIQYDQNQLSQNWFHGIEQFMGTLTPGHANILISLRLVRIISVE